jgi:hypothetical protein
MTRKSIKNNAQRVHASGAPGRATDRASQNSKGWSARFLSILKRDYRKLDPVVASILENDRVAQICAMLIRDYVDKGMTDWLYKGRKIRGDKHKKKLDTAIAGINEAVSLYGDRGRKEEALYLSRLAVELAEERERSEEAFATKRHGRDRAHLILYECQTFLQSQLGQRPTHATLANLVNAGFEADGNLPKDPVTEEHVRKNLENFASRNPAAAAVIDALAGRRP